MEKNDILSAEITDYTHDGMGVAHIGGRAVFVQNAAVGDAGLVRVVKINNSAAYAIWEKLEAPSDRRAPSQDCPLFPKCGGCDFRHITYAEELRAKASRVRETLKRIGGFDMPPAHVVGAPELTGWRNKAVYPVSFADGHAITGFYRARSHEIVPCGRCVQLPESADLTAEALRKWLDSSKEDALCMLWREGAQIGGVSEALCCVSTRGKRLRGADGLVDALRRANPTLRSIWHDYNPVLPGRSANRVLGGNGQPLWGEPSITTRTGSVIHTLNPYTFGQVNHAQMENMLELIRKLAALTGAETVLDLYCGTGVLGLNLAPGAKSVTGIEIVPDSVAAANEAAKLNGIGNYTAVQCDASGLAGLNLGAPDLVIADPPRKGQGEQALAALRDLSPDRIIYVSCDPATLARDLSSLTHGGYGLKLYAVIDMFPRTANVETVCLLEK